jgi:hypothetical protein
LHLIDRLFTRSGAMPWMTQLVCIGVLAVLAACGGPRLPRIEPVTAQNIIGAALRHTLTASTNCAEVGDRSSLPPPSPIKPLKLCTSRTPHRWIS